MIKNFFWKNDMKSFVKFLLSVVVFLCVQNFIFAAKTLEQIAKENKNINNTKKQKLVYYNPLDAKHYVLLEQVIGVISPFKETEISSAELMKASKECIDLFNRAVETEKEPYIIQTPQKAVIAWTNVKENSKQNSFIKIADKRISEWNAASKTLENHEKSFQKVLKFAKGKAASAKQKKELMLQLTCIFLRRHTLFFRRIVCLMPPTSRRKAMPKSVPR